MKSGNTKKHQQELTQWLKEQSSIAHHWLYISRCLDFIGGLLIVAQSWILAHILHSVIIERISHEMLLPLIFLTIVFVLRILISFSRERTGFYVSQCIRHRIRKQILDELQRIGPAWIQSKPIGSWSSLILEHIDDMHDYYAHYLPQVLLAVHMPIIIVIILIPINWISALILTCTAPLVLIFMIMVGMNASDANRKNFLALTRLSGHFLDRLRGMETLRLFNYGNTEKENIRLISQNFRKQTMEVLRIAFLSSGVLEFFISLSIALVAVYFGFSYLGVLNFGHYNTNITLFSGFLVLILAPEFFRPLRDLGMFYHAKAQAIGAADNLKTFLDTVQTLPKHENLSFHRNDPIHIVAKDLSILSPKGKVLVGPLNFVLSAGSRVALVGESGSGKSSLLNTLAGFLHYTGSLRINQIELYMLNLASWREVLGWVGQNPQLPAATLRDNVLLARKDATEKELNDALKKAWVDEFLPFLPDGVNTVVGDQGACLSVGQAQRVAIARIFLSSHKLLLLDEPTASLDTYIGRHVMNELDHISRMQTTLIVTHQLDIVTEWDKILVMKNGKIVEQGDYKTLYKLRGVFFSLLTSRQEKI